jgi:molecular chaperone DnaJ
MPRQKRSFKEAAEAYDVLGDEQKRKQYDQFGHQAFGPGGQPARFTNVEDIFQHFGDIFGGGGGGIFGDLFGGGNGRRSGARSAAATCGSCWSSPWRRSTRASRRSWHSSVSSAATPATVRAPKPAPASVLCDVRWPWPGSAQRGLLLDGDDVPHVQGRRRPMLESPCGSCNGTGGQSERAEVKINVPAGVEEGMQLRVPGEGDAGPEGAPRGDLYCVIREQEHKVFQRSGPDVIMEAPFSFTQLALGDKVEIPTLRGRVEMTVPPGTQTGKVFRLRAQGLPRMDAKARGDQLVRVFCEIPEKLSERQKELLREFQEIEGEKGGKKSFYERVVDFFS